MPAVDLTPITQPILDVAGIILTGLIAVYLPKGIAAFERRTGIMLTDQQNARLQTQIQTAAGMLETKLDQGVMNALHIEVSSPEVAHQVQMVLNTIPTEATALGVTEHDVARAIVGAVDTASHPSPLPDVIVQTGTVA